MGHILRPVAALCAFLLTGVATAETVTYTGTTRTAVSNTTMPLANGDSVALVISHGVAALSSTPPTIFELSCMGLGVVGERTKLAADFYCSLGADDESGLDIRGTEGADGSKFTVIGGQGRWASASGQGTFTRVSSTESTSSARFEMTLTTP